MANDLQITHGKNLAALCSQGFSSYALDSLVDRPYPGIPDRIIDRDERAELHRLAAEYERALIPAERSEIEESVAMLSLAYPALKVTAQEGAARIELYAQALGDIPSDVLRDACMAALRECKFFPSVSEIRERCPGLTKGLFRLLRIRHLIAKHDAEWREPEPEPPLSAEDEAEMAMLRKKFGLPDPSHGIESKEIAA